MPADSPKDACPGEVSRLSSPRPTRQYWIAGALVLALLSVCTLLLLSYSYNTAFVRWNSLVIHTREVLASLEDLSATLREAQLNVLNYYNSGSPDSLRAFQTLAATLPSKLERSRRLAVNNPVQQGNLELLGQQLDAGLGVLREVVNLHDQGKTGPLPLTELSEKSADTSKALRAAYQAAIDQENHLLVQRTEEAATTSGRARRLQLAGGLLAVALLLASFLLLARELSARAAAERRLGESNATLEQRVRELSETREKLERVLDYEQQFRVLIDNVQDYAIFLLDPRGYITTWNIGAQRINGYTAPEIIGRHFSTFFSEEDKAAGRPQRELEIAERKGRVEVEAWRVRKDGSRLWANATVSALHDSSGKLTGFAKITRDFTERMEAQQALRNEIAERTEAQHKLAASEESLRELSARLLRSQEEERRRLGRELHDSLGQSLSMLKLKLDTLETLFESGNVQDAARDIAESIRLAADSISEVRTISYLLYPPLLEEMGLETAIPWYVDGFSKRSGIVTSFELSPDFGRLSQDAELALFRVLQEGLTNVHRHSGSHSAEVRLLRQNGTVVLQVKDQGRGFAAAPASNPGGNSQNHSAEGVGLRSMKERLQQLGGRLDLASSSEGTVVTAVLPTSEQKVQS